MNSDRADEAFAGELDVGEVVARTAPRGRRAACPSCGQRAVMVEQERIIDIDVDIGGVFLPVAVIVWLRGAVLADGSLAWSTAGTQGSARLSRPLPSFAALGVSMTAKAHASAAASTRRERVWCNACDIELERLATRLVAKKETER